MLAIAIHDFGAPPTVTEIPDPKPGTGEVLIQVQASSINVFDIAVAAGRLRGMTEYRFPVVLGRDFAGVVAAVGEEVSRFAPGDRVFGVVATMTLDIGTLAEYVTAPEAHGITHIPDGLSIEDAGALGVAGTAAHEAVDPKPGEAVLIVGATGGVGGYAIQLAAARGATVIATARTSAGADCVRDLGATHVIDRTADLRAQVRTLAPQGVPAVLHLAGDGSALADVLGHGGRFASLVAGGTEALNRPDATAVAIYGDPKPATLQQLAGQAASGALRVPVTRRYPFKDAPLAFTDFAAGTVGKLAVTIG